MHILLSQLRKFCPVLCLKFLYVIVTALHWFSSYYSISLCCYEIYLTTVYMLYSEWRVMKNRKFVGTLLEQNIRAQSKPWIMEVDGLVGTKMQVYT